MNKIKEAIDLYNQNKSVEEEKMTQARLANIVMHDYDLANNTKIYMMSHFVKEQRKIDFELIRRICKTLQASPAFVLGLD